MILNKNHIIRQFSGAAGWKFNVFPPTFSFSPLFDFFILGNFMQTFASTGYCEPFFWGTNFILNKKSMGIIMGNIMWKLFYGKYHLGNIMWKTIYGNYYVKYHVWTLSATKNHGKYYVEITLWEISSGEYHLGNITGIEINYALGGNWW